MGDGRFERVGRKIGKLVDVKNAAYGSSFHKSSEFLKLLYPDGVKPEQYQDMLTLVRVFDKQMRIATDKDALGESPWNDIGGYSILAVDLADPKREPPWQCKSGSCMNTDPAWDGAFYCRPCVKEREQPSKEPGSGI